MRDVEHAESFVGEVTQPIVVNELLYLLGCIEREREGVAPNFKFDVVVVQRVNPRKLLVCGLNPVDVVGIREDLKAIE